MLRIKFRYKDKYTHGNWSEQECTVSSVEQCKKIYGLGIDKDCDYEITSIYDLTTGQETRITYLEKENKNGK